MSRTMLRMISMLGLVFAGTCAAPAPFYLMDYAKHAASERLLCLD